MRKITWLLALAAPVLVVSCQKDVQQDQQALTNETAVAPMVVATNGNGAPSGTHYNLNIIGVPKGKSADMTGNNGGRIFVSLDGKTKINLTPAPVGESFQVLDANGTDGTASFQLPKDVSTAWTVWARVPGNQDGSVTITTCAEQTADGETLKLTDCASITIDRLNYGKFSNVSTSLLYVTITRDITIGGVLYTAGTKIPLFDERLEGYFWDYDNNGLKLLQLRFYPVN